MMDEDFRLETDSMGEVRVPRGAYWGAETQRAVENFPLSGLRFPRRFLRALGLLKKASALVNMDLGRLDPRLGEAIIQAAGEVAEGKFDSQFVVDVFQTGSGTSTHMNANEVIANRANELLGGKIGEKKPVHPNDHVNRGQSSNDVIPSAMHLSALEALKRDLGPALDELWRMLREKAGEFDSILKIGRTHLQDATPIRLGQEFSGYASMVLHGLRSLESSARDLEELAMGGTAVGTGMNTHPEFGRRVAEKITRMTGLPFREAEDHFQAQGAKSAVVQTSGALKGLAADLWKIANDLRWLGSGPRAGIGELLLPETQPGSSMMPGKVNPVIPEVVCQVAAQALGNDVTITLAGSAGNFELNVMMPVMAYNLLQSIDLLAGAARLLATKCLSGLRADEERCRETVERSLALGTALSPRLGYDGAAKIVREAYERKMTIREVVREKGILPLEDLDRLLDPWKMTGPG